MARKEIPDPQDLAALSETFSRLGWDERVPSMLFNWGRSGDVKFTCDGESFSLIIKNKDRRNTAVSLESDERNLETKHIRVAHGVWLKNLVVEGYPVRRVEALNPGNIELDVEPALQIKLDSAEIKINRSGQISGKL